MLATCVVKKSNSNFALEKSWYSRGFLPDVAGRRAGAGPCRPGPRGLFNYLRIRAWNEDYDQVHQIKRLINRHFDPHRNDPGHGHPLSLNQKEVILSWLGIGGITAAGKKLASAAAKVRLNKIES